MGTYRYYMFEVREEQGNELLLNFLDFISKSDNVKNMDLNDELKAKDDDYRIHLKEVEK